MRFVVVIIMYPGFKKINSFFIYKIYEKFYFKKSKSHKTPKKYFMHTLEWYKIVKSETPGQK